MPTCYFLTVCTGSSVDQQSNNVTLFNLVEQVNVPPGAPPPPGGALPLEVHAYWNVDATDVGTSFDVRYVLVASSGLESPTDAIAHRSTSTKLRTRTLGVPVPPVLGHYELRVDSRSSGGEWVRQEISWPMAFLETPSRPRVTH